MKNLLILLSCLIPFTVFSQIQVAKLFTLCGTGKGNTSVF